ncbi:MAG: tectonin domain-containing protein, partial [Candidatus Babeliales bacterium]
MRKNLFYLLISILIFANVFINVNAIPPATFTYNPISGVPGAAFTNPDWKTDSPGNFVVTFDANTQNNIYVHLYAHKVSQSYVAWQHGGYYYHVKIDPYQTDILCFNGETNKTTLTPNKSLKVSMGVKESWWISLKDNKTLTVGKGIYPNGTTASWTIPDDYALAATYFGFGGAGAPTYFENIKIISQTKDVQTAKKGRFLHRNSANNMYYFSGNTDANGQMAWKQIDGASKDIAITADGQMICVGMDDAIWYSSGVDANGKANWKKQNGTAATHVAARGNKFMCRNSANNMYVFSGKADSNGQMSWKQIDGQAKSVAIAGDGQM